MTNMQNYYVSLEDMHRECIEQGYLLDDSDLFSFVLRMKMFMIVNQLSLEVY